MSSTDAFEPPAPAERARHLGGMAPTPDRLPPLQASVRLRSTGMPTREWREELRRIPAARNGLAILSTWAQSFGLIGAVHHVVGRTGWWLLWAPTFLLMGRSHAMFNILGHEAAHRLLFANQRANDWIGKLLCSYPSLNNQDAYRRVHMAHHRDEFGPDEPDLALYAGYPITSSSFWRKMRRDAFGASGYKNLLGLLRQFQNPKSRAAMLHISMEQAVLFVGLGLTVGWWAWPVLWMGSWLTVWRVLNRLRAIAEHAGMQRSKDTRATTHHVRQGAIARFCFAPFFVGHHLAHHVDAGIPMWHLPALTRELQEVGYLTDDLTYPSYRALWRQLRSRPSTTPLATAG